jgi:hypothetical protein
MAEQVMTAPRLDLPILLSSSSYKRQKKLRTNLPDVNKKLIYLSHKVLEMVKVSTVTTGN